jgi:hypothetical protein
MIEQQTQRERMKSFVTIFHNSEIALKNANNATPKVTKIIKNNQDTLARLRRISNCLRFLAVKIGLLLREIP